MSRVTAHTHEHVTTLTINRPEVHNCIDGPTAVELGMAIMRFAEDDDQHVLVVTGAGEKSFCTGADLKSTDLLAHELSSSVGPLGFARLDPGKPTIAAINGYCFAGGLELAAWCDFRIASETAEFGALNRRFGVPFVDGGTARFARTLGLGGAMYVALTGARLSAQRAQELGFVQEVVKQSSLMERTLELATTIARYPQVSVRSDRRALLENWALPLDEGIRNEREIGDRALDAPELLAGLDRFRTGDRPQSLRG